MLISPLSINYAQWEDRQSTSPANQTIYFTFTNPWNFVLISKIADGHIVCSFGNGLYSVVTHRREGGVCEVPREVETVQLSIGH
jgi:hypothetical protein